MSYKIARIRGLVSGLGSMHRLRLLHIGKARLASVFAFRYHNVRAFLHCAPVNGIPPIRFCKDSAGFPILTRGWIYGSVITGILEGL